MVSPSACTRGPISTVARVRRHPSVYMRHYTRQDALTPSAGVLSQRKGCCAIKCCVSQTGGLWRGRKHPRAAQMKILTGNVLSALINKALQYAAAGFYFGGVGVCVCGGAPVGHTLPAVLGNPQRLGACQFHRDISFERTYWAVE